MDRKEAGVKDSDGGCQLSKDQPDYSRDEVAPEARASRRGGLVPAPRMCCNTTDAAPGDFPSAIDVSQNPLHSQGLKRIIPRPCSRHGEVGWYPTHGRLIVAT
jgi:hypothetical protein